MPPDTYRLTEVEHLVLLAVLRLEGEAYAVPIRALIAKEAAVEISRGSVYITLERLEEKGFVESWFSEPRSEPGGKARKLFRMLPAGMKALKVFHRIISRLTAGTPLARKR